MAARAAFALDYYLQLRFAISHYTVRYWQVCGWSAEDEIWREEEDPAQPTESGAWLVRALCPMRGVAVSRYEACRLVVYYFNLLKVLYKK